MVGYANYLISLSMNINGNLINKRKIINKKKGCTFKITNIQLARRENSTMRDFSIWNLSGILNIYLMSHHLKAHQSQSHSYGEEGHLVDEVQQSCWPIRGSGGDDQSSS